MILLVGMFCREIILNKNGPIYSKFKEFHIDGKSFFGLADLVVMEISFEQPFPTFPYYLVDFLVNLIRRLVPDLSSSGVSTGSQLLLHYFHPALVIRWQRILEKPGYGNGA